MIMIKNDFKEKTAGRRMVPMLAIFALVLSACLWYAVLLPQRDLIGQLQNNCETGRQYIAQVSAFAKEYPDYENYLKELDKKLDRLNDMLPNKPALSEFLQETELLSREAGVAVVDIKPLAAVNKDGWRELPLEIIATGNFEDILEFSKRLESSRRFVSITAANVALSAAGQAAQAAPELESRISLVIYMSKELSINNLDR